MDPRARIAATNFEGLQDAEHVPHALCDLDSPNAAVRQRAVDSLYARLHRHGSVDAATVRAVPIIVDIANAPSTPDRHALFALLAAMLSGLPRNWRDGFNNNHGSPAGDLVLRIEHEIVRGARGFASYVRAVDPRIRGTACALVGLLCGAPEFPKALHHQLATVLRCQLVNEAHPRARASALLASSLIGHRLGLTDTAELSRLDLRAQTPIVRLATAAALLRAASSADPARDLPDHIVDGLSVALDPMSVHDFPWAGGDPTLLAAEALTFASEPTTHVHQWSSAEARAVAALRSLVAARAAFRDLANTATPIDRAKQRSIVPLSAMLLETALRAFDGRAEPLQACELSPDQLDVVRFIAVDCALDTAYARFGLPPRSELAAFLATAEPRDELALHATS